MDKRISYFIFSCLLLWTGSDGNSNKSTSSPVTSNPTTAPLSTSKATQLASVTSSPKTLHSSTTVPNNNEPSGGAIKPKTTTKSKTSPFVHATSSPKPGNLTGNSSNETVNTASTTTKKASLPKDSSTSSPASVTTSKHNSTATQHPHGSRENLNDDQKPTENSEKKYLWILLPVLCVLLAATIYLKFKCKKVQHRPEMTDNGTENASFQRTDSNKDGVMLLGVNKMSGGEDNEINNILGTEEVMKTW